MKMDMIMMVVFMMVCLFDVRDVSEDLNEVDVEIRADGKCCPIEVHPCIFEVDEINCRQRQPISQDFIYDKLSNVFQGNFPDLEMDLTL